MNKIFTSVLLIGLTSAICSANAMAGESAQSFYKQENFVANKKSYSPALVTDKDFINAWAIAIRPKGAGGHFWVTAKDVSYEYVGDVRASSDKKLQKLFQDNLAEVKLPVGGDDKFATGTVFSDSKENFVITQEIKGKEAITAPAKFLFSSDGGIVSAWTEKKLEDGSFIRSGDAVTVIDQSQQGSQFFGLAISSNYDWLYVADFGKKPEIKVFDGEFKQTNVKFDMPFDDNKNGVVDAGEYAPFNVQALQAADGANRIFVTYAKTQSCPKSEIYKKNCAKGEIFAGEEDTSKAGYGKLAEFGENGNLIKIWNDAGKLDAPWGIAFAPKNFGEFSNRLLIGNFGSGKISVFDEKTGNFIDFMRNKKGNPLKIDKLWGLLFGNGESLGDANALYFAAGSNDEKDGIFGRISVQEK